MAKYGLFRSGQRVPLQTYDGDYLMQDREFVKVMKKKVNESDEQVAAVNLDKSESIKKISD